MRRLSSLLSAFGWSKHVDGREVPDPRPVEIPAHAKRPESLSDMVARMVHAHDFRKMVESAGAETVEEASDFDIVGDDPEDVPSAAEMVAMQLEVPSGAEEYRERLEISRRIGANRDGERGQGRERLQEDAARRVEYRRDGEGVREVDGERAVAREVENAGRPRGSRSVEGAGRGTA